MNDAFRVRRIQCVRHLNSQIQNGRCFQRFALDALLESLPVQVLHGDEWSRFVFPDLVDGADVRVIERRCGSRFALESLDYLRITRQFLRQKLQSHLPT